MLPGLQEWIHSIEEGKGAAWIKRIFLLLLFAGLAAIYDVREFTAFNNPEAMDSAQISRNIAEGKGFTTGFIRPLSIRLLQSSDTDMSVLRKPHPDLAHAPVYPLMIGGLMKVVPFHFGVPKNQTFIKYMPEIGIAVFNQILFAGLLMAVYVLAKRLFDLEVARTTVVILAVSELLWRFSISGLPTLWLCLLTVLIVICLMSMETKLRPPEAPAAPVDGEEPAPTLAMSAPPPPVNTLWLLGIAALTGALVGLGMMTRYSYGWFILPVIGFAGAFLGARRGQVMGAILIAFLVVVTPWLARNYQQCGRPFGLAGFAAIQGTPPFTGNRFERSMPQNLELELNKVSLAHYLRKLIENSSKLVTEDLPTLGGSWVTALFLAGLLVPFRNPSLSRLRLFVVVSLLLFAIVQGLGRTHLSEVAPEINSENLLVLFTPLVAILGVALFFTLIDQIPFAFPQYRAAAVGGFICVMALPLTLLLLPPRNMPLAYPPYYPPFIQEVADWMREDELMMSDMPWAVAWYGHRQCLWTTLDAGQVRGGGDFFAINDFMRPIKGLYLTPITMDSKFLSGFLKGQEGAWSRFVLDSMLRTNVPAGFPLKQSPRGFLPDFLFLTDRIRWQRTQD